MMDIAKHKRKPKNTPMEKRTTSRRSRTPKLGTPNTAAANEVVTQSVAAFNASTPDPTQPVSTTKSVPEKHSKITNKRTHEIPKPLAKSNKITAEEEVTKEEARPKTKRKRTRRATTTEKKQETRTTTKTTRKRTRKQTEEPPPSNKIQATDTKETGLRSPKRTRSRSNITATRTETSPDSQKSVATKTKTRKTTARTASKKTPEETKLRSRKTAKNAKSTAEPARSTRRMTATTKPMKRRHTAKHAIRATTTVTPKQAENEYVVGFQGIYYKPFRLTSKDLFMSVAQQDHFLDILTRAKEKLIAEEAGRANQFQETDASNLPDPLDQGANEGVFHNELRTRDRESQLVRKINRAIDCIRMGSYGYCEACGCEIPIRRLEARPIVTKCIDCKERDELRERQLGQ